MQLADKIRIIRKARGFSQEQLGDKLSRVSENGISRQAVSDWENGKTEPKLDNIRDLAEVLNVSYDALLDEMIDLEDPKVLSKILGEADEEDQPSVALSLNRIFSLHYEYVSKTKIFNMPLVHVNFGFGIKRAKGIIAIGNIATGFISIGIVSLGLISLGFLALGLLFALGVFSLGFLSIGAIAVGFLSVASVSVGYFSVGAVAVGKYSIGAFAYGSSISFGARAIGGCPIDTQNGTITYTRDQIRELIELKANYIPEFIKQIFISLGA